VEVSPRDVVAATLPDPRTLGDRMRGRTCAGTVVTGHGQGRRAARGVPAPRRRQRATMRDDGCQAVVWQTAINPVIALELLAEGAWEGVGVLGPEAFPPGRSSSSSPRTARRTPSRSAIPARPFA
jgi:saccharopine dehydrogenase-like NADP-dependent oxidoreductase